MVRGLTTFRKHFAEFSDQYVLIGGAASVVLMEKSGLPFRGTRDLDMVLIVEALSNEFIRSFWEFVHLGRYGSIFQGQAEKKYYRFDNPEDKSYPECIELFSRIPEGIEYEGHGHITPIPVDDDISSLSAILLDSDYYQMITEGCIEVDGLSCLKAEFIILLKAKAWLDMNLRLSEGKRIDSKTIKKHRNDVVRLFPLLNLGMRIDIPSVIKHDLNEFLKAMAADQTLNLKDLGIRQFTLADIISAIRQIYQLSDTTNQ